MRNPELIYMKKKHSGISVFSAQITSTISVALVLLLLGIVAFMGIAANSITNNIKSNMGFDVILKETASIQDINQLKQHWTNADYVSSTKYYSPEDALHKWQAETGENLIELLGANPFSPEFEVKVKHEYANVDSIKKITSLFQSNQCISEIKVHSDMIDAINNNIQSIAFILVLISAALMLISFVLINNTIRLTIYSRRFLIHTMKLVGATAGFIRRPFIINNILHGFIAAIIAILFLAGTIYYIQTLDSAILNVINLESIAWVFASIILLGIIICALAALLATNKYLRIDYDDMFK